MGEPSDSVDPSRSSDSGPKPQLNGPTTNKNTGSNTDPNSHNDMETLVSLQNKKVQLEKERDALASKKSDLLQSIDMLSHTLTHYKDQQLQYEAKQKLQYYLHQNTSEFSQVASNDENASFVLDNLDVLPSRDPVHRLGLIGKFYPYMEIQNQAIESVVDGNTQYNKISYTIRSKGLPPLQIELLSRHEKVHSVTIVNLEHVAQLFHKISPSYSNALSTYYTSEGRIDLIMYSYHALAELQAKRIDTFSGILRKNLGMVSRPHSSWVQNPTHSLMCLDYIELTFTEKRTSSVFKVRLRWDLVLASRITGEVESSLEFSISKEGSGLLQRTNSVFLTLAATHGVEKAFDILSTNLFKSATT